MTLGDMRSLRLARRHGTRLSVFSFIGASVFFAGLAFQVALVRYAGLGADSSYAAQAIFSIELSYLLNRYLTWRNRDAGFWLACWKFTAQKLIMTVVNLAAYALLVRVGVQYIAANVALTAVFTPVNYFAADLLVFVRPRRPRHRRQRAGRAGAAVQTRDAAAIKTMAGVAGGESPMSPTRGSSCSSRRGRRAGATRT
jgi:putative flippase GtrA